MKVPKEATADSYGVGTIVFVGLADGVQRISSDVEYIVRRHSNASGTEPTPDLLQQVLTLSKDAQAAAQYAAGTPVQVSYKLAEPVPFTATGAQPIPALAGVNTVLTDANSVTVTGRADPIKRITDLEDATASQT